MAVYRVPTKAYYRKNRLDKTKNWNDIYGTHRCSVCKQHFREKDAYTVTNDGRYQHVECPKKAKHGKKTSDKVRVRQPKLSKTRQDIH